MPANPTETTSELSPSTMASTCWPPPDVRQFREGPKRFRRPMVGDLDFIGESLDVSNTPGLFVLAYTIEPGSKTAEAMSLMGSWTASNTPFGRTSKTPPPSAAKAEQRAEPEISCLLSSPPPSDTGIRSVPNARRGTSLLRT